MLDFVNFTAHNLPRMIKSMTGFGQAESIHNHNTISAQIRSLNSKQNDLSVRMPSIYREKELKLRSSLSKRLVRGKIELMVQIDYSGAEPRQTLNTDLALQYHRQLQELGQTIGVDPGEQMLNLLVRMPDVMQANKRDVDEGEWEAIVATVELAVAKLDDYRATEGNVLETELSERAANIQQLLIEIEAFEAERKGAVRERLMGHLKDANLEDKMDANRFEQELIYYLEKLDITEEKVRLSAHLNYFLEVLGNPESSGKKLGFIGQEMGREINTIGSKANHVGIQQLVVQMKDELEKIKEQVLNVL